MYSKIKNNISDILVFIITIVILWFLFLCELPYYIDAPGGITNLDERFKIKGAISSEGDYNISYVREYDGVPILLLFALINPDWDIVKEKDVEVGDYDIEDLKKIDKLSLNISTTESVLAAYKRAGKKVTIKSEKYIIIYTSEESNTNLQIGDTILEIANQKIEKFEDVSSIIAGFNVGDKIDIKVENNKKNYNRYAYVYEIEGVKKIGISCATDYEYVTNPEIKFTIDKNEYGSSGGFMTSLAIYDYLIEDDLTHGLKIVGTGTIDIDGKVGEIGGVKYKLKGAIKNDADIFFVPNGKNYEEAIKLKKKHEYDIKIIGISTLDDAISYLENL